MSTEWVDYMAEGMKSKAFMYNFLPGMGLGWVGGVMVGKVVVGWCHVVIGCVSTQGEVGSWWQE